MFQRQLQKTLERFAKAFPVVAITGPRQSGKTTLARSRLIHGGEDTYERHGVHVMGWKSFSKFG
jgi:predicted AAA+ superfamily ATPase